MASHQNRKETIMKKILTIAIASLALTALTAGGCQTSTAVANSCNPATYLANYGDGFGGDQSMADVERDCPANYLDIIDYSLEG